MIRYAFPPDSMVYCRTEDRLRPHRVDTSDRRYIACIVCKRRVHAVEVITTYATDTINGRLEVMPPLDMVSPVVYAAKLFGWRWDR